MSDSLKVITTKNSQTKGSPRSVQGKKSEKNPRLLQKSKITWRSHEDFLIEIWVIFCVVYTLESNLKIAKKKWLSEMWNGSMENLTLKKMQTIIWRPNDTREFSFVWLCNEDLKVGVRQCHIDYVNFNFVFFETWIPGTTRNWMIIKIKAFRTSCASLKCPNLFVNWIVSF